MNGYMAPISLHLNPTTQKTDAFAKQRESESPEDSKLREMRFKLKGLRLACPEEKGTKTDKGKRIRKLAKKIRLAEEKKNKQVAAPKIQSIVRRFLTKIELRKQIDSGVSVEEKEIVSSCDLIKVDERIANHEAEKAEKAAIAERRRAKRARQKKAKKAKKLAKAAAGDVNSIEAPLTKKVSENTLFRIACSESFRREVYKKGLINKDLDPVQKELLGLIYFSNLPMFPRLIGLYTPKCYKLMILLFKETPSFSKIKTLLNSTVNTTPMLSQKYTDLYVFIEKNLQHYSPDSPISTSEDSNLKSSDIKKLYTRILNLIPRLISEEPDWTDINVTIPKERDCERKTELLKWENALNNEIQFWRTKTKRLSKKAASEKLLTHQICLSLLKKILEIPAIDSFYTLFQVLALEPLSEISVRARTDIHREDITSGGVLHSLIEQIIVPKIVELKSIEAFGKVWQSEIYQKTVNLTPIARQVFDAIQKPKPFHQILLDKMVEGREGDFDIEQMRKTVSEAYDNGSISPYSRTLFLHFLFLTLNDSDEGVVSCIDPSTNTYDKKKLQDFLLTKLLDSKGGDLAPIFDQKGREIVPQKEDAINYRILLTTIMYQTHEVRNRAIQNLRANSVFLIKNLAPLTGIEQKIKQTN